MFGIDSVSAVHLLQDGSGSCRTGAQGGLETLVADPAARKGKAFHRRVNAGLDKERILGAGLEAVYGTGRMSKVAHVGQRCCHVDLFDVLPDAGKDILRAFEHGLGTAEFNRMVMAGWDV